MNTIGVVVLNYNKYELSQKCVDKMVTNKAPVQIVIVDNNSDNNSFELLKDKYSINKNVDVIRNFKNGGYANGNNYGIRYLMTEYKEINYYCVMNPDIEIEYPQIFDNLKSILDNYPQMAMITGKMITNGNSDLNKSFWNYPRKREAALGHALIYKRQDGKIDYLEKGIGEVECVTGSFFMIKRSAYERLNGFDEGTFLYNEENIMGIRLNKLGMTCGLSTNDTFNHNHPKGSRLKLVQKIKSRKNGNQSRRYMCKAYYKKIDSVLLEFVIAFNYCYIVLTHLAGNLLRLKNKKG